MAKNKCHATCILAVSSGSGKTTLSLGLMRALRRRGIDVAPFKCGPDYIDPEFHGIAAGCPSVSLDLWMMGRDACLSAFKSRLHPGSCAIVEGVMGAFDSFDPKSAKGSSADLARELSIPALLVVDASGMAGTLAAIVSGCTSFMPGLRISGVVANFVSSTSHRTILEDALSANSLPPLLGCLPKMPEWKIPERHLGLLAETEARRLDSWYDGIADAVEANISIDKLLELSEFTPGNAVEPPKSKASVSRPPRMGIAFDDAFHFYYQDNLDAFAYAGAEIVKFSPLSDSEPPPVDGMYIGGGFPEVFAERLSANKTMRESIRNLCLSGLPVYAECGGLMYLGESLRDSAGDTFAMCGVMPVASRMHDRLHRLGYRQARTLVKSPLGPAGTSYRGHEFHWSGLEHGSTNMDAAEAVGLKPGAKWEPSAFLVANTFASYVHAHFASNPDIPAHFVSAMLGQR